MVPLSMLLGALRVSLLLARTLLKPSCGVVYLGVSVSFSFERSKKIKFSMMLWVLGGTRLGWHVPRLLLLDHRGVKVLSWLVLWSLRLLLRQIPLLIIMLISTVRKLGPSLTSL